ncbi:hypothetical protein [Pseudomonas oryzihabitans]|nr:hypothetical protein [Pseudomonas oryzihabitans]
MSPIKAVFAATALLIASQVAHAEESTLMQNKLVAENHKAIQAEKRSEATASNSSQTVEQKKSC